MPISHINHKGKDILFADYSECKNKDEMVSLIHDVAKEAKSTIGKVLFLYDFSGVKGSPEFNAASKQLSKEVFDHKIEKGALLGIDGLKKVFVSGYNLVAKVKFNPFDTKEEAIDYLVS